MNYGAMIAPGRGSTKVTPSNVTMFFPPVRLWIGTAGNISVTFEDGTIGVNMPAQAGFFPFFVTQVNTGSAETAADNIWTVV